MKKVITWIFVIFLSFIVFILEFENKNTIIPNYFYQVYLDEEVLGVIESKKELEEYIDKMGTVIKEKYNVDKVYSPNGLQIKRIITYNKKVNTVEEVYDKLKEMKPFTIDGYRFTIKHEDDEGKQDNFIIYTTSKDIFEDAVTNTIKTYVGEDRYNSYKEETQEEIVTTGEYINNIYVEEDIVVKNVKIPVNEQIFTDSKELSRYILFGSLEEETKYTVKVGDTLEKIADNNKIGVVALLISNPTLTSKDNLLYNGQELSIIVPKPLVTVIEEYTSVEDRVSQYEVEEVYDSSMNIGDEYVSQEGIDGIDRVTSSVKKANGDISSNETEETVVIKPSTSRIVKIGTNRVSTVGSLIWWKWPTAGSMYNTSGYDYRWHPVKRIWQFHQGLDIPGNGCWSPIYASNNGVVMTAAYDASSYGYYIIINHNNGYYTLYAHMYSFARGLQKGSTVSRGQVIGYMGMTGTATGCHLHYELWNTVPWSQGRYSNDKPIGNLDPRSVTYH